MTTHHIQSQVAHITAELKTYSPPPRLLVATKYASIDETQAIIDSGVQHIGENRIQDALEKKRHLSTNTNTIEWHMIGHLQSNKINKAIDIFDIIESIDSVSLLKKLNTALDKKQQTISGYLQVNIGNDPDKSGFSHTDIMMHHHELCGFKNITIRGIMVVTPLNCTMLERRHLFKKAHHLFKTVQDTHSEIDTLSMGMSNDYKVAIEEGSTLVRIGRIIFK
jgi:pyridoxal phosphate enzyme (YggS family)